MVPAACCPGPSRRGRSTWSRPPPPPSTATSPSRTSPSRSLPVPPLILLLLLPYHSPPPARPYTPVPSAGGAAVRRQEPLRRLQVHDRRRPTRGLSYRRSNGPPTALQRPSNGSLTALLTALLPAGTRWRFSCGSSRTSFRCAARRCASSTCTARARCEGDPREPRALPHPPMSSTH